MSKNRSVDEGETTMPLVHIDLQKGKTSAFRQTVSDIVYHAIIETVNVPANDRFQVITESEEQRAQAQVLAPEAADKARAVLPELLTVGHIAEGNGVIVS
jgi:hypothetical protein